MEANRKESCDFNVIINNEEWHIEMAWIQANGEPAWYEGKTYRNGVCFTQIFSPDKITVPPIEYASNK